MSSIRNNHVQIYNEVQDALLCGVNDYGKPNKCTVKIADVMGDLQQLRARTSSMASGEASQSTYDLFLDPDSPIDQHSRVRVDGVCYSVMGGIARYSKHIELTVVEER